MDHARFSAIAHSGLRYMNPLPPAFFEGLLALMQLEQGAAVLDLGCGKGEFLLRLSELYGVKATGVDRSPYAVQDARREAGRRAPPKAVIIEEGDASGWALTGSVWNAAICIGAGPLVDLDTLARMVPPGGWVVAGDAHWQSPPSQGLLAALGVQPEDLPQAGWLETAAEAAHLDVVRLRTATDAEWEAYEEAYAANVEAWALENRDDPSRTLFLERARAGLERHRSVGPPGFTVGLFRKRPARSRPREG